ncbi:MAG: DUF2087 domain-containing protein [Actinomycetota bacterium]
MRDDLDAARLVGLLAQPDRRRVVAALVLGATDLDAIGQATGLERRSVVDAVWRLRDAGLIIDDGDGDGSLWLIEEAFARAAKASAPARSDGDEGIDRSLRAFVRDGRIVAIPTNRTKRLALLDLLAQEFAPGERYPERTVNTILGRWHDDTATLRRYLVDEDLMSREDGIYWRSGGTVDL